MPGRSLPCSTTSPSPCFNLTGLSDWVLQMVDAHEHLTSVQKAFSKQASHYDEDDFSNRILLDWRDKVYAHVNPFLKPCSSILELNAGTGIDALHFVHA